MCLPLFEYWLIMLLPLSKLQSLSMSVEGNERTSRLWRAAAQQLEVKVVRAKTLALQVLQQLTESGSKRLSAMQAEPIGGRFDLEILILSHRTGLP